MEKDCEDRVAELETMSWNTKLELEAAARAATEEQNKSEVEDAARLACKSSWANVPRRIELERQKQLKHELEVTKQRRAEIWTNRLLLLLRPRKSFLLLQ